MRKVWGTVREFLPMAAIVVLCMLFMPVAQAHAENNGPSTNNGTSVAASNGTSANVQQQSTMVAAEQKVTTTPKPKAKVATKPREKSVLDAEVLESPLGYFRDAFCSEEEESDAARSGAIIITVKALVATLLSTVM